MVRGLVDQEIQKEVLGTTKERTLEEIVTFVEARESSRRSVEELCLGSLSSGQVDKLSLYQGSKKKALQVNDQEVGNRKVQVLW